MCEFDEILFETPNFDIDNIINDQNPINLNYVQLKQDISAIKDKSTTQWIHKSNYCLTKLEEDTFHGFFQLLDLDLSHNLLMNLPIGIFDHLWNLQTINLSHNLITELENCIFRKNIRLRIINLSNNIFNEINGCAFNNLHFLQKLDFSFNKIHTLQTKILKTISLEELNLNSNEIVELNEYSFKFLENLIHLNLSNNKLMYLGENIFKNTRKIENLNLSNNYIKILHMKAFDNLLNIQQLDLSNNLLLTVDSCYNKPMLNEINLLNNPLDIYWISDLCISKSIRIFKLTIYNWMHDLDRLTNLVLLSDFELHVKAEKLFSVYKCVLPYINASTIQRLHMVIQRGQFGVCNTISNFVNLEFLHIQFLEPNLLTSDFNIGFHINKMPKLKHLALININKMMVFTDSTIKHNNLTYLDLTGIDNPTYSFLQSNFAMLEYLNLSNSEIRYISRSLFKYLSNLKYLIMNNTGISIIGDNVFQYNIQLEVIEFRDCQIHTIGENCFWYLMNLKQIDIRGNTQLRITESLLNGIPKSAIVFYD